MDIQMPEMNGFEATSAIREKEKASGRHIPIIAMTANAMKGDREKCLQAGMDAYIAKPIRSQELFRVIEEITGSPEAQNENTAPEGDAGAAPESGGDTAGELFFDEARFRESSVSTELMQELIVIFQEDMPPMLKRIESSLAAGDADTLHEVAHSLKGLVGNFYAAPVFRVVTEFDDAARSGDLKRARELFPVLQDSVGNLESRLCAFNEKLNP